MKAALQLPWFGLFHALRLTLTHVALRLLAQHQNLEHGEDVKMTGLPLNSTIASASWGKFCGLTKLDRDDADAAFPPAAAGVEGLHFSSSCLEV